MRQTVLAGPILIVDDMDMSLMVMKLILNKSGYDNVITFDNPNDALAYVTTAAIPSLIITDYNMPEMNGIEFLDTISSFYPHLPTVIISGDSQSVLAKSNRYRVIEKGGRDFFENLVSLIRADLKEHALPQKSTPTNIKTVESINKTR